MNSTSIRSLDGRSLTWVLVGAAGLASLPLLVERPLAGCLACMLLWTLVLLLAAPRGISVAAPLLALLTIPADHMDGLSGPAQGFFVLAGVSAIVTVSILRRRILKLGWRDWDLFLLAALLIGTTVLHAGSGELRGLLFWVAGCLAVVWLRAEEPCVPRIRRQVLIAIVLAGAIGGLVAALQRVGLLDIQALIPAYEPADLEFASFLGSRASGLSGHPLRLGTLTMLSAVCALALLSDENLSPRKRAFGYTALAASVLGLVLSGARGAWISLAAAALIVSVAHIAQGEVRRAVHLFLGFVIVGILVYALGLQSLVYERTAGAASHPVSLGQRLLALQSIGATWRQLPWFGVGFGGAADVALRAGLRVPNLENEYLRFLVTAGVLGPLALMVVGIRRFRAAWHQKPSIYRTAALGCVTGMLVNVATYNFFSWSISAVLFFAIACVALPTTHLEQGRI